MLSPKISFPASDKEYRVDELLKKNPFPKKESEFNTVEFINEWLSGQDKFLLSTSGSTGSPKTIVVTRQQMIASTQLTAKALHLSPGYTALICLNTNYIAGKMMVVRCLETGMDMVIISPSSNPFDSVLSSFRIDFAALVPLQLQNILNEDNSKEILNKIKTVIIGGGSVSKTLENRLQNLETEIYSTYGMTETVSHIALRRLNGKERTSFFKAFDEVMLGQDARGCLTISSVLSNYQLLTTNDVVELIGSNSFVWKGRIDFVINSGGLKIHPEQLEPKIGEALTKLGINSNFFIAGLPDEYWGEKVCLILEAESLSFDVEKKILNVLRKTLKRHEIPKQLFVFSKFIYTETGKINRKETIASLRA